MLRPLLLLPLAALARADYGCVASYSAGTWKSTSPSYPTQSGTFGGAGWSKSAATGGVGGPPPQPPAGVGYCETKSNTTVVATLTWSGPSGTEPPAVVVKEASSAQWQGDTGDCGQGLPLATSDTYFEGGALKTGFDQRSVS